MTKRIWLGLAALALALAWIPREVRALVTPGDLVIREFRLRGPSSATDEYIIIHNRTASDITVAASDASAGFGVASSNGSLIFTIPNGTVIKARGHYLAVNTGGFSLGVPYNAAWTADVTDGLGLALFDSSDTAAFGSSAATLDAVGVGGSSSPYVESSALTSLTTAGQYAWTRKTSAGAVQDTNVNTTDFVLVATDGGTYNSVQSILGAPSPSNSSNQVLPGVTLSLIEPAAGANDSPNRERIYTPVDRFELRRRITNNTGAAIDAIRLRVVDLTTLNSPGYASPTQADLRPSASDTVSITATSIGVTSVAGLGLLTPPVQSIGGGWNSILTIPGGPLANGASRDVNIALAISREGTETFSVTVETAGTLPVSQPVMDPPGGAYGASQSVELSTETVGAEIRYTTDGSTPTASSTLYSGTPISIGETKTLKAIGLLANWADSPVASATYTLSTAAPVISPNGGVYLGAQSVAITSATEAPVDIWYTVDGSTPVASSPSLLYAGPFNVSTPVTIKAATFKTGWTSSPVTSATFTPTVATPAFSPAPGTYTTSQSVTISTTPGATIHYTTDGSTPTVSSPTYTAPLNFTQTTTLRAAAFMAGWADSLSSQGTYTLKVADPVLSPAIAKSYTQRNVTVTTATPGAALHYTTDGSEPTTSSTVVPGTGIIPVPRSLALKVKAFKAGLSDSGTSRGQYLITGQIRGGDYHSMALKADRTVWTWGTNFHGQIGDGSATGTVRLNPVQVVSLSDVIEVSSGRYSAYALKADGTVWAWGYNASGQLGDASNTNRTTPVQVSGITTATAISAGGEHLLILLADGTVRSVGENGSGQLGRGNTVDSNVPVTVTGLNNVVALAAGRLHNLALKADGSVASWGGGTVGQLGDGVAHNLTTFTTIPGLTALSVAAGGDTGFAITDAAGSFKAWGLNTYGQLADGSTTNRLSPVPISTPAREIAPGSSHVSILGPDARIQGAGYNVQRSLGDSTTTNRSVLTRSRLSKVIVTLGKGQGQSLAVAQDGAVWATGPGGYGILGLGHTNSPSLPTAIPSFSLFDGTDLQWDLDGDGLNLHEEFLAGTDGLKADSNGNGMPDGAEFASGLDPAAMDSDGDGLSNEGELFAGTNPFDADSDNDGSADGVDQAPLDPTLQNLGPTPGDVTPPIITLSKPVGATPNP